MLASPLLLLSLSLSVVKLCKRVVFRIRSDKNKWARSFAFLLSLSVQRVAPKKQAPNSPLTMSNNRFFVRLWLLQPAEFYCRSLSKTTYLGMCVAAAVEKSNGCLVDDEAEVEVAAVPG